MSEQASHAKGILLVIILGLAAWGVYHTVGIFRSEPDLSKALTKAAIVAAAMLLFLGFWGLLLRAQQRRPRKGRPWPENSGPDAKP